MSKLLSQSDFLARARDAYAIARQCKQSSEQLQAKLNSTIRAEVNSRTASKRPRYSPYMQGYAEGIMTAMHAAVWQDLEFAYDVHGTLYSTDNSSTHRKTEELYAAGLGDTLTECEGHWYWRGTNKVFC